MRFFAIVVVFTGGCSITDFDVDQPIQEQQVMGSPIPGPLQVLFPIPLNLDISAAIKARDTGPIDSVTLESLKLSITKTDEPSGDSDDWSFLTSVDVYVSSTKSGSTLPKVKIATASMPGAVQDVKFMVEGGVNLKPYIDEGSTVEGQCSGNAPPDDVSYDGSASFTVHPL
jgi:hypothetical protein